MYRYQRVTIIVILKKIFEDGTACHISKEFLFMSFYISVIAIVRADSVSKVPVLFIRPNNRPRNDFTILIPSKATIFIRAVDPDPHGSAFVFDFGSRREKLLTIKMKKSKEICKNCKIIQLFKVNLHKLPVHCILFLTFEQSLMFFTNKENSS